MGLFLVSGQKPSGWSLENERRYKRSFPFSWAFLLLFFAYSCILATISTYIICALKLQEIIIKILLSFSRYHSLSHRPKISPLFIEKKLPEHFLKSDFFTSTCRILVCYRQVISSISIVIFSEISCTLAKNPFEKWEISYPKCRSDLPLGQKY